MKKKREIPEQQRDTAERMHKIRSKTGYTQEKFAEVLDVAYSTYKKIERAESGVTVNQLRLLKKQLGVSADYLLFGDNKDFEETWVTVQNLSENDKLCMFLRLQAYLKETCRGAYVEQADLKKQDDRMQEILKLFGKEE